MKYCPFCGAVLMDGAFKFCPECGEGLSVKNETPELQPSTDDNVKHASEHKVRRKKHLPSKPIKKAESVSKSEEYTERDDYDGYYDDVIPANENELQNGIDKALIKKIAALGAAAFIIILICVAIMYFL